MRRGRLLVVAVIALLSLGVQVAPVGAQVDPKPDSLALPNGFHPEGVAVGDGPEIYAGSLATGAIWKGDVRTGTGDLLVEGREGGVAVGLDLSPAGDQLFVAGGPNGDAQVYDTDTGDLLAQIQLSEEGALINDVIVTPDAAWFTDSFGPVLYQVPLDGSGGIVLPATSTALSLGDGFPFEAGDIASNGIVVLPTGDLVVGHFARGELYRVDPATGEAELIDLAGTTLVGPDGLILKGRRIFVVENVANRISIVRMDPTFEKGRVFRRINDERFSSPATAALRLGSLYVANARFEEIPPPFGTPPNPDAEFELLRLGR